MKRRLEDYVVCSGSTAYALGELVLKYSKEGWDLEGGVFVGSLGAVKADVNTDSGVRYYQAMALYKGAGTP